MMGYKKCILNIAEKISCKTITWKTGKEFNDEVKKDLQETGCEDRSMNTYDHRLSY
jgi:isopentenyl diphosphate isomerase/L-lactate dehydrogenase-like FMN-dependent dehydrogenase